MSKQSTPASAPKDRKVLKALELIESGADTVRGAVRKTGANRSTVRHHLRARGWKAPKVGKSKPKTPAAKKRTAAKRSAARRVVPASGIQHHLIASQDGQKSLTVFIPGESPVIVAGDHPKFDDILDEAGKARPNVDRLRELADTTVLVETKFRKLTERISARNGKLYLDGDEMDTALTQKIVSMLDEGDEDWGALVNFLEKLYQNPNPNARDAFYAWLRERPFGITPDGDVIGWKRVRSADEDDEAQFRSWHDGPAVINGEPYEGGDGGVPQSVGDTVEKPRSEVDNSTRDECSDGLHVGTYEFADGQRRYGDTVLRLRVNPRDVVGVPVHVGGSEKFRCCRYVIDGVSAGKLGEKDIAANA